MEKIHESFRKYLDTLKDDDVLEYGVIISPTSERIDEFLITYSGNSTPVETMKMRKEWVQNIWNH